MVNASSCTVGYELALRHLRKIATLKELEGYFIDFISVLNGNMNMLMLLNSIKQIF